MKKIIYTLLIVVSSSFTACQGYLDVVPDGDIETIETTFEKREDAYKWLKTCYAMIVNETADIAFSPAYWGTDEVVADEYFRNRFIESPQYLGGLFIGDGLQMAQNPYGGAWTSRSFYGGIRYCNIFLEHIDGVYNMREDEKTIWKAEVQAVKAQYYFELLRRYGPFILVPENISATATIEEMQQPRRPIDECVKAIVDLCDEAIPSLPHFRDQETNHYCYFNKEAAATLKAMALLYAASPLFNGNDMLRNMVNKNGDRLFPEYDKEKWRLAAEAADDALTICRTGGRTLITGSTDRPTPMLNIMRDIEKSSVDYGYTNTEAILLVRRQLGSDPAMYYHPVFDPSDYHYDAYTIGGFGASMKMASMFYTEHGLPLDEDKQWMASRYSMTREVDQRYANVVPINKNILSLHRRREPRFYADIAAHGTIWFRKGLSYAGNEGFEVNCLQGGNCGSPVKMFDSNIAQCLSGYYIKKYDNSDVSLYSYMLNNSSECAMVMLRLPDLLLASAEAWNEYLDAPDERVYGPLDQVRVRAGIAKVRDAWQSYARNPQKVTTKAGMRGIIHDEWNIEFMFEGRRFYNLRRWMTAPEELNTPLYGWNILGDTEERFFNNFVEPVPVWKKRGFSVPRDYFFPIGSEEVMITGCKQNPGWD